MGKVVGFVLGLMSWVLIQINDVCDNGSTWTWSKLQAIHRHRSIIRRVKMLVDLDKVKEMIKFCIINGETKNFILSELDKLAYGKLYTCWVCGGDIYAGEDGWYHTADDAKECRNTKGGSWVQEYRATPKPKDMEG